MLWRWRPRSCRLYDFREGLGENDAKALLAKLGDSRLVLIGDSMAEEQFISLQVTQYLPKFLDCASHVLRC